MKNYILEIIIIGGVCLIIGAWSCWVVVEQYIPPAYKTIKEDSARKYMTFCLDSGGIVSIEQTDGEYELRCRKMTTHAAAATTIRPETDQG